MIKIAESNYLTRRSLVKMVNELAEDLDVLRGKLESVRADRRFLEEAINCAGMRAAAEAAEDEASPLCPPVCPTCSEKRKIKTPAQNGRDLISELFSDPSMIAVINEVVAPMAEHLIDEMVGVAAALKKIHPDVGKLPRPRRIRQRHAELRTLEVLTKHGARVVNFGDDPAPTPACGEPIDGP